MTAGRNNLAHRIAAFRGHAHYSRTDSLSMSLQWIAAGIGASSGGRGAGVSGHTEVSTSCPSMMEISRHAPQYPIS